ncbi:MAG TPA: hypothetical protein DCE42_09425 [Myxococcales bacterium]|nr:hypothetical protein [Deltaproteobacteria bacterium]MBU49026.1 hypothetical protein [Deltaproteobacteria bacterium]HAA54966.1 hypothetical protein [Myxococcales bacterium]|tara:strand:- start:10102 stop:10728 length:627 start_codon:yes stop_codon:yes gene_type:complete
MMGMDGDVLLVLLALGSVGFLCWNLYHGFLWLGESSARRGVGQSPGGEQFSGEGSEESQVVQLEVIEWDVTEDGDSEDLAISVEKTKTNEPPYTPSLEAMAFDDPETVVESAYIQRIRGRLERQELHTRMSNLRGILSQRPSEQDYHALRCALDFWPIEEGRAEGIRYVTQHLGASTDSNHPEEEHDEVGRILGRYELLLERTSGKDT